MTTPPTETFESKFSHALSRFVTGPVTEDTELVRLGLDSLSLVRIIVYVMGDDSDREIDPGEIGNLRTVADLHAWLGGISSKADNRADTRLVAS